ncbi:MAG: acyltransferase family protein [Candidatus Devosia phytovorans]|uniref:Acyltransferase family protein n=1 Tax=Candidatus Devosia phytovorans TaxID=3121372 RepID=A0AAJ5VS02_9HYPH|nr:acyltransferase family protein [Devosia sp.]WEK03731.1 MAG: acyltransferase family protein [Devosia sp.]
MRTERDDGRGRADRHVAGGAFYRPEIDGLRAVAVVAVVLYHFGVWGVPGGFVGVDIFFVISGFLIGGILWRELAERGRISLPDFFIRRIRRLAPAYVVMAILVSMAGWAILLPFEFREFGKSLIASTVYLSNVYFFSQAGYFDIDSSNKILLHTWSLSLEEQFYFFLPVLLLVLARWKRILLGAIVAICAASLLANLVFTPINHSSAFYLFPFRAWELLAGVLLAIYGYERAATWKVHGALSWIGLGLIIATVALISAGRDFPGFAVLAPVLGTVLLILNGRHANPVNRLLTWKPVVSLGLISYSLYLWHWPVVTLWTYYRNGQTGPLDMLCWLVLSLLLAYLSWRFVELPFRHGLKIRKRFAFGGMVAASVTLVAIGFGLYRTDGLPSRFQPEVRTHIEASADFLQDWSRCAVASDEPFAGINLCPLGPAGAPKFLVWGDSHARAFKEGLERMAAEQQVPGILIWRAGCPPLFGIQKQESATTRDQDEECTQSNERILQATTGPLDIDTILLIGRWSYYAQGAGTGYDAVNTITLARSPGPIPGTEPQIQVFDNAVTQTLDILSAHFDNVFVLRQVPEVPWYDSRDVARKLAHGGAVAEEANRFSIDLGAVAERSSASEVPFKRAIAEHKVTWIDLDSYFCNEQSCSVLYDGQSSYFDNNHVTNSAAIRSRDLFVPLVKADANPTQVSVANAP